MAINVSDNNPRVNYTATSGQTVFTVSFEFFEETDLTVYINGTEKTLTTDYSVTGGDGSTGTITLVTGATASDKVAIVRDVAMQRTTDFTAGQDINREALNEQLDKLTALVADIDDRASRALQLNDHELAASITLPATDDRKGKVLGFNEVTGDVQSGPSLTDVQSLADVSADIATLADIEDGTDATDAIQTAAGISSDITTVSGISSNVTTVAGISSDVTAVAADATDIGTVATNISSVNTVATNIADVITVANDLNEAVSEVVTVADDLNEAVSEIDTVAGSISNVDAVGTNIADVSTVAGISSDVTTVSGISANTSTVAGIASNVTSVAGVASDVTTVAGISSNVSTVSGISANVTTVAGLSSSVSTLALISSDITTVAGISANVTTVAGDTANIATIATDLNGSDNIGTVAGSISNVNSVGGSISNVNTVATNLSSINDFADKYRIGATDPTTDNDEGDLFYNTTSDTLKVYTGSAWEQGVTAGSGFLPLTGGGLTGDLTFGDNNKATFGAGSDLSIFSNGTDSFIQEYTTGGHLYIDGTNVRIRNRNDNTLRLQTSDSGAVDLYYSGSSKLATTSTGVDVTGTVTADGLTVNTNTLNGEATFYDTNTATVYLQNSVSGTTATDGLSIALSNEIAYINNREAGDLRLYTNNSESMRIASNGDISFYEDTGTTPKFFWDASAESLGIGTSSPNSSSRLHVEGGAAEQVQIRVSQSDNTGVHLFSQSSSAGVWNQDNTSMLFATNDTERMRITSSGNVGISSDDKQIYWGAGTTAIAGNSTSDYFRVFTNNSERMRIDSSGNVGIGTTSPSFSNGKGISIVDGTSSRLKLATSTTGSGATDGFELSANGSEAYIYNYENSFMAFGTNATERMRIDSSGVVRIGGQTGTLKLGNDGTYYADIEWEYNNNELAFTANNVANFTFNSNGSERMRIDSNGHLLVGKSTSAFGTQGIELQSDGELIATKNGTPIYVNRITTDGAMQNFYKDGSLVGSIGSRSNAVTIGNGDTGLRFDAGADTIYPEGSGTYRDAAIDIGGSSVRFKDGHFSGTVNAANFNTTSDATLKTNVETLTGSLDAVKALRGVSFDWIESGNSEVGVIAQEVEAVVPDVVSTNDQGIKSVKYGNLVGVLIEAIKEQQAQIDELKAKLGE